MSTSTTVFRSRNQDCAGDQAQLAWFAVTPVIVDAASLGAEAAVKRYLLPAFDPQTVFTVQY